MATAFRTTAGAEKLQSQPEFVGAHHRSCARCGGLLASEFCMDLLNSAGELDIKTLRCVQCGDIVDPVILANRASRQTGGQVLIRKAKRTDMQCGLMRQTSTATVVYSDSISASGRAL